MSFSISKKVQPDSTKSLKGGTIFYRVKRFGEIVQDFKTKEEAVDFIKNVKRNEMKQLKKPVKVSASKRAKAHRRRKPRKKYSGLTLFEIARLPKEKVKKLGKDYWDDVESKGKMLVRAGLFDLKDALQGGHSAQNIASYSFKANRRINKGRAMIKLAKIEKYKLGKNY